MLRSLFGAVLGSLILATHAWGSSACVIFADSFQSSAPSITCPTPAGLAFKGPLVSGGTVTLTPLDDSLTPTGSSITIPITNDEGAFSIPTDLVNKILEITATGRFFNEISGQVTSGTLTLKAITRPDETLITHVSVLTTVAVPRIRALVADGNTATEAIGLASQQIFGQLFGTSSEENDLANIGPGSPTFDALLAFGSMLLSDDDGPAELSDVGQITEFFANDLADGQLSGADQSIDLKSFLVTLANWVDADAVQTGLSNYYQALNSSIAVPNITDRLNRIRATHGIEITITQQGEGSITPAGTQWLGAGDDLDLALSPAVGRWVEEITGSCTGQLRNNRAQFIAENITAPCTIEVVFGSGGTTLSFDSNGGSPISPIRLIPGTNIEPPTDPTRAGHTFISWQPPLPSTMPNQDLSLTAQWSVNTYTLSFDSQGGSAVAPISASTGSVIQAPAPPSKVGHDFLGWDPALPETMPTVDQTFTAQWTPKNYSLSFDTDGGQAIEALTIAFGASLTGQLPAAEKVGHRFVRWENLPDGEVMPAQDLTLKAVWAVESYTLTLENYDGGFINAISQAFGSSITVSPQITRAGYTLTGWSPPIPATMPAQDTTVVAQWSADPVTVSFDTGGGTSLPAIETVTDATLAAPEDPRRSGYVFFAWDPAIAPTAPPSDQTYTALWNPEIYALNLNLENGTQSRSLSSGTFASPISAVTPPQREGFDFQGYFTQPNGKGEQWFDASGTPTDVNGSARVWNTPNDVSLYAHWLIRTSNIIFSNTAHPVSFPLTGITEDFGTELVGIPSPTQDGFDFLGWSPPLPATMPATDLVVSPTWARKQYQLTLFSERPALTKNVYDTLTVPYDAQTPSVDPPTRVGHTFTSWAPEIPDPMWAKNSSHFAEWSANDYTVTFDLDGGSDGPAPLTVTFGINPISLATDIPTKAAFDFAGFWTEKNGQGEMYFDQGADAIRPWDIPANTTLYAHWTQNTQVLVFDSQGGSWIAPQYLVAGDSPSTPADPIKLGHTFTGWSPGIPNPMPANNVQVDAQWTANTYLARLISEGATSIPQVTVTFGQTVPNITPPTREGHNFLGYFEDRFGNATQFYDADGVGLVAWLADEDRYLYADWERNDYTLSFDLGYTPSDAGITPPSDITQGFGTVITPPIDPVREGHTFTGWDPVIPETVPASNQTHTAQWTKNNYTIVFDGKGGSAVADLVVGFGDAVTPPTNPTRTGFDFDGWAPDLPATMPDGDLAVVAKWVAKSYAVTLDAQGGTATDGSVTATYGDLLPQAAAPNKSFASFAGYWTAPNGGGEQYYDPRMVPTQAWDIDADTTLYAHWIEDTRYTVNLVEIPAQGGTTSGTGTYPEGQTVTLSATPSDGYVFVGFYESDSVAAKVNPYNFPAKRDRNLVARFTQPPTAPVIRVTPRLPSANFDLVCEIHQASVDPDGDPINYEFIWTRQADANSPAEITDHTEQTLPASATSKDEIWSCEAYAHDGWVLSEASSCENLDRTQSGAPWAPSQDCGRPISVADYCAGTPCQNGGACSEDADRGTFVCDCSEVPEWSGDRCDTVDACALATAAGENPCGEFGECYNDGGGYRCACKEEYIACACCNGLFLDGFPCTLQNLADTGEMCVSEQTIKDQFGPFN